MIFLFSALLPLCTILHHAYHLLISRGIGERHVLGSDKKKLHLGRITRLYGGIETVSSLVLGSYSHLDETNRLKMKLYCPVLAFIPDVKRVIFQLINALELVCVGLMHVQGILGTFVCCYLMQITFKVSTLHLLFSQTRHVKFPSPVSLIAFKEGFFSRKYSVHLFVDFTSQVSLAGS